MYWNCLFVRVLVRRKKMRQREESSSAAAVIYISTSSFRLFQRLRELPPSSAGFPGAANIQINSSSSSVSFLCASNSSLSLPCRTSTNYFAGQLQTPPSPMRTLLSNYRYASIPTPLRAALPLFMPPTWDPQISPQHRRQGQPRRGMEALYHYHLVQRSLAPKKRI